jgi:hypothetical protein
MMDETAKFRAKLRRVIRALNRRLPPDEQITFVIGPGSTVERDLHELVREGLGGMEGALLSQKGRDIEARFQALGRLVAGSGIADRADGCVEFSVPFPDGTKFPVDARMIFNLSIDHSGCVKFGVGPEGDSLMLVNAHVVIPVSGLKADSLHEVLRQLHFAAEHVPVRLADEGSYRDWWAMFRGDDTDGEEWKRGRPAGDD